MTANGLLRRSVRRAINTPVAGLYLGPSLDLDFAANRYRMGAIGRHPQDLPASDIFQFARNTGGGRTNPLGQFEWVGPGVQRLTYDPVTLKSLGILVEEQRTNKVLWAGNPTAAGWYNVSGTSEDSGQRWGNFVGARIMSAGQTWHRRVMAGTPTAISAQEVVTIIYRIGTSGRVRLVCRDNQRVLESFVSGVPGSLSAAASAGALTILVDKQITSDGIWQLSVRFEAGVPTNLHEFSVGADSTVVGAGVILFFAQIEAGATQSSLIPTEGSQVTRAADVPLVNTLAPWFNAAKGTLVVSGIKDAGVSALCNAVSLDDGTGNNRIQLRHTGTTGGSGIVLVGGVAQAGAFVGPAGSWPIGESRKAAISYEENSFAFSCGGIAPLTDNAGAVPTVSRMVIGSAPGYSSAWNGIISRLIYYPRVLDTKQAGA